MWKIQEEVENLIVNHQEQEEINDKMVMQSIRENILRERYTEIIYRYLAKTKKNIWEIDKRDLAVMTENRKIDDKIFMEQFMKALKTNRWKPIDRIIKNKKSIYLNELND